MDEGDDVARRTFTVIDICEILQHWDGGFILILLVS
jgi:hypothetical protein